MSWEPLRGRIAIREILPESYGSIVVPQNYHDNNVRKRTSHVGRVLAMGPPPLTKKGAEYPAGFSVGDQVLFIFDQPNYMNNGGGATEKSRQGIWQDGGKCVWVTYEEILGVYEDEILPYGMDTPEDPRCEPEEPLVP